LSTRIGYRVGEPGETNARKLIEFEVEELGNEHLIADLANVLGTKSTLQAVLSALHYRYGPGAVGMWLCDSPEWAEKRYGPGEAYRVKIPAGAIVGSDLGPDGKLWIWRAEASPSNPIRFIVVRFLKDSDAIRGIDSKTYGPYKKGDVAALPKENASMLMKLGVAERKTKVPGKPSFKKVISGEVLTGYQEAAKVKPLVETEEERVEKVKKKVDKVLKDIKEARRE
jgi:hypothetical protein